MHGKYLPQIYAIPFFPYFFMQMQAEYSVFILFVEVYFFLYIS